MSGEIVAEEGGTADVRSVAEKRREQIVDAAVRLFAERGYFQTTIEDVANAVPISKGLVYRYFKDKNDLLYFTLRYVLDKFEFDEIQQVVEKAGPLHALMEVLRLNCGMAREHTLEVLLAYKSTKDLLPEQRRNIKVLESKMARFIRQCLESCVHRGLMTKINTDIMSYQYIMYGHAWALKNWAFRDRYTPDEYLAEGEMILIYPFLTEAGRQEFSKIRAARS
ncbi:MAG: TetR/AcrR family transcriptional regulator [Rhodospirillales bacterium]|nr:TetR/AcrR family transcriptional regulator [Rhodospirillales bacterium]